MKHLLVCAVALGCACAFAFGEYSWQKPHAKVHADGDMEWAPEPFEFTAGDEVRYIDFENGDDASDGLTRRTPWKHHPWDRQATGKAAQASGPANYVFKRGVFYRRQLQADESGNPNNPIRLTSEPAWGEGEATLAGSVRLPADWVPATSVESPDRLPEAEEVWALDLRPLGVLDDENRIRYVRPDGRGHWNPPSPAFTGLSRLNPDGSTDTLHLARDPDWQPGNDNFVIDYWHQWDGPAKVRIDGKERNAWHDERLKDHPEDYFDGGYLWSQYAWFMGTPTARKIGGKKGPEYVPEAGAFLFGAMGGIKAKLRYMIENLPQYLDTADEFYLDHSTGILFYRPPTGRNPNELHLELTTDLGQISIENQSHIEMAGLAFRFAQGNTIAVSGNCTDINIHHCNFRDCRQFAIKGGATGQGEYMDRVRIADCRFERIWETAVRLSNGGKFAKVPDYGLLGHVDVLRNYIYETGMRHNGNVQSNVPAVSLFCPTTADVAGNILKRSFGSGIVVFGGKEGNLGGSESRARNIPFIRILVHHNETEDTALAVNDYGGMAIWQGGPTYVYCNNIGNSPGHMPAGVFNMKTYMNLSYPLYLDGAYKIYSFNNIIWGRTTDPEDTYHNMNSGYFMVFGFLNHFVNNTIYRQGKGIGGSSGNRCDVMGNVMSEISKQFLANNRTGDPSLVGGGDTAGSGIRGVPSLAFANNVFYGEAEAGRLIEQKFDDAGNPRFPDVPHDIKAEEVNAMAEQMQTFPIRCGRLGKETSRNPIVGSDKPAIEDGSTDADFRLRPDSPARDYGVTYFIPWSLYGTVGEWHFTENHAEPDTVVDYHWYMSEAHMHRKLYEQIPTFDLFISGGDLDDFVPSPSEDWTDGALQFDGHRYAYHRDERLRQDIQIKMLSTGKFADSIPEEDWEIDEPSGGTREGKPVYGEDDYARYPAAKRKTLIIRRENLLVEANLRVDDGHTGGAILGKHDGENGYRLFVNDGGAATFQISSGGAHRSVATARPITDGEWHHVLAEVDRQTGRMTIYLDGEESAALQNSLHPDLSLDNRSDFLVGKAHDDTGYFEGTIDFMRVCRGTLEDAQTDIAELYEWQTNGPFLRDFRGNEPTGRRDAGALERTP